MRRRIVDVESSTTSGNDVGGGSSSHSSPLLARGAFGDVTIALHVAEEERRGDDDEATEAASAAGTRRRGGAGRTRIKVELAAVKTIRNAAAPLAAGGGAGFGAASSWGFAPPPPPAATTGVTGAAPSTTAPDKRRQRRQLSREAFAELNAHRLLPDHPNLPRLLAYYPPRAGSNPFFDGFGGTGGAPAPTSLCLAFEYHPVDLASLFRKRLIDPRQPRDALDVRFVKSIARDVLNALVHCHRHGVIHRDVKPANLMLSYGGNVVLTDFGLAKAGIDLVVPSSQGGASPSSTKGGGGDGVNGGEAATTTTQEDDDAPDENNRSMMLVDPDHDPTLTHGLTTLPYRPPELLFSSPHPTSAIDVWSTACTVAESCTYRILFPGRTALEQMSRIFDVTGTPDSTNWPSVKSLPDYGKVSFASSMGKNERTALKELVPTLRRDPDLNRLLETMLTLDPARRPTAYDCLRDDWFHRGVPPASCEEVALELLPDELHGPAMLFSGHGGEKEDELKSAKCRALDVARARREFDRSCGGGVDSKKTTMGKEDGRGRRFECRLKSTGLTEVLRRKREARDVEITNK